MKNRFIIKENQSVIPVFFLVLYAILLVTIMVFHEPWFDEAQSWLIARDASYHDMLFFIPHYEGHPPLWWLLLSVPAKLGVPYELGLKSVQAVFAVLAMYLLLFRSPFPLWVRCALPFSYFFFYQYGVQSRPYGIMTCAFFLSAMTWQERNVHPFRFCLSLALLCLSSAYGIIIAGGIALAWTVEILRDRSLFSNRARLAAMLLLLVTALVLISCILPAPDTFASARTIYDETNSQLQRFYYAFFCLPSEATVTSCGGDSLFQYFMPDIAQTIVMTIISLVAWAGLIIQTKKSGTVLYLVFPCVLFLGFSAARYFNMHHVGILLILFLFSLWISQGEQQTRDWMGLDSRIRTAVVSVTVLGLLVNCSWSVIASVREVTTEFSAGKALAAFVKENDLQNYKWSASWAWKTGEGDLSKVLYENTHEVHGAVFEANPYLEQPLLGEILSGKSYTDHILPSEEQMDREKKALEERGADFYVGIPDGNPVTQRVREKGSFVILKKLESEHIWKDKKGWNVIFVCGRPEIKERIEKAGELE